MIKVRTLRFWTLHTGCGDSIQGLWPIECYRRYALGNIN